MQDWFHHFIPDTQPVILKLRLQPYTLGHEILLRRFHSPFVPGSAPASGAVSGAPAGNTRHAPTIDDLVLACVICSQDFDAALKTLRSPAFGLLLKIWQLRVRPILRDPRTLAIEIGNFIRYRAAGRWQPEANRPLSGGRELKAPDLFRLLAWLMKEMNMGGREALNTPMAQAHILWAAQGDHEGTIDLFGGTDAALLADLERREKTNEWN